MLTMPGIGQLISTRASTRDRAMQMAMGTILPAAFLSGYVFPADLMPGFFRYLGQLVSATWLIDAARGRCGFIPCDCRLHAASPSGRRDRRLLAASQQSRADLPLHLP